MKKNKVFYFIVFCFLGIGVASAHDPAFSQFYANPLYLNPAFAGTARCPRVVAQYRNQWPSISQAYVTYSASFDQHIDALNGGVGVLVTQDRAGKGTLNSLNASGIYSYQLTVSKNFTIKTGFQVTYLQKSLGWDKLVFSDQFDAKNGAVFNSNEVPGVGSKKNIDFSAGLLGFSKKYFFGFAAHHLTQPNVGLADRGNSKLPMKLTLHAGAVLPLSNDKEAATLSPNIIYQYQGKFNQLCLGMYASKGVIVGGLWYRNTDSFIALIGFQKDTFKLGYSYDYTLSKLSNSNSSGSHEVSLGMTFGCKTKTKKFSIASCPTF